jgi:hypothetical protein
VLSGLFGIEGVSVLTELTIVGLLGAAYVVGRRGGGERWARWGATGFALLALERICSIAITQWMLHSSLPMYYRVRRMDVLTIGQWLVLVAGLALLLAAVLVGRGAPGLPADVNDRARATPGGVAPPRR